MLVLNVFTFLVRRIPADSTPINLRAAMFEFLPIVETETTSAPRTTTRTIPVENCNYEMTTFLPFLPVFTGTSNLILDGHLGRVTPSLATAIATSIATTLATSIATTLATISSPSGRLLAKFALHVVIVSLKLSILN